jgi:broad specificity phosphatase PhoE
MTTDTLIYTIRHGRTEYNDEKRYAGSKDIPLSETGIKETLAASAKIADFQFDVVITSPMKRALESARLLVKDSVPIVQSKLCNERNFGIMEGHTWDEIQKFTPPILMIRVGNDMHTVNPRGGEPFEVVWKRAQRFRHFMFKKYRGSRILLVSHGVFLQMFHGVLRDLNCIEALGVYPANLELTIFQFTGACLKKEKTEQLIEVEGVQF